MLPSTQHLRFVHHSEAPVPKPPRKQRPAAVHLTRLSQYRHISNTPQPHSKFHRQLKHISIYPQHYPLPSSPRSKQSSKQTNKLTTSAHAATPSSPQLHRYMLASRLRPFLHTAPRFAVTRSIAVRSMASTSAPLQEWLVIVPDHEGALQKRIAVRQDHLGGLKKDADSFWLWGGTLPPFTHVPWITANG